MVEKFNLLITPFKLERTIHVYLPDEYYYCDQKYPVMYMFDGHNLFSDEDATYGKSWGLEDFMNNYDKKLIIVGIECNHEGQMRLSEYCPYQVNNKYFGYIDGQGTILMNWVIRELKPFIDQNYRTYPFRECTGVAGSSMGGLMALYTVLHHNDYFSKAACVSPAISICMNALKEEYDKAVIASDTRVYFSFGTKEVNDESGMRRMLNNIQYFNTRLIMNKSSSYINVVKNGQHNEASWQLENKIYLDFLWK